MAHLKALYFLRPSSDNVQKLRRHLAAPRFAEYHLFFSNILKIPQIQVLADSDEQEVVQQVQEFYGDFCATDPYHFTLNIHNNHIYMLPTVVDPPGMQSFCDRAVDGIASVFLALKRRPVIRCQRTSDFARRIAQETTRLMYEQESGLFDFRQTENTSWLLVLVMLVLRLRTELRNNGTAWSCQLKESGVGKLPRAYQLVPTKTDY